MKFTNAAQERRYVKEMAATIAATLFEQWLRPHEGGTMKQTMAAERMVQWFGEIYSIQVMAPLVARAEQIARTRHSPRLGQVHIEMAMEEMERMADPMAPDYDALATEEQRVEAAILDAAIAYNEAMMIPDYTALAAEEPTSQIEDCRDSAEVVG